MKIKSKYLFISLITLLTFSCNLGNSSKPETKNEKKDRIIRNIKLSINSAHSHKDTIHPHYDIIDNIMNRVERGETLKEEEKLDEATIDKAIAMGVAFHKDLGNINAPVKELHSFMNEYKGKKSFTKAELEEFKALDNEFLTSKMNGIKEILNKIKVIEKVEQKIEEAKNANTYAWWDSVWSWVKKAASDVVSVAKKVHEFLGGDNFDRSLKDAWNTFNSIMNDTQMMKAFWEIETEA